MTISLRHAKGDTSTTASPSIIASQCFQHHVRSFTAMGDGSNQTLVGYIIHSMNSSSVLAASKEVSCPEPTLTGGL